MNKGRQIKITKNMGLGTDRDRATTIDFRATHGLLHQKEYNFETKQGTYHMYSTGPQKIPTIGHIPIVDTPAISSPLIGWEKEP